MLNNYQILTQLQIIKKQFNPVYDTPKIEALNYAILATIEKINNREPCIFDFGNTCRALVKKNCFNCNFKCSKKQYEESQKKVQERHKQIGIRTVKDKNGNYVVDKKPKS